jgi:single-strand DNA-binding protein
MASYNKVVLLGNVVRNPELHHVKGDSLSVVRTSIAVNHKYKDKEEVMFIDIVVFGKQADILNSYATKGTSLLIDGRLSQNSWEQNGVKRSKHEIIVDNFQLLNNRKEHIDNGKHDNDFMSSKTSTLSDNNDEDISFPFQLDLDKRNEMGYNEIRPSDREIRVMLQDGDNPSDPWRDY